MPFFETVQVRDEAPKCDKCGRSTKLAAVIQRLGSIPGYRIFECTDCLTLKWIVQIV
jgi:hypothetical protein